METSFYISTKIGKAVMVDKKEFIEFMEVFELLHPDYVVKKEYLYNHLFTNYYVNDERYCFTID